MFKTIIVPTDGSEHANKAVVMAADLAGKYGAKVIVLHTLLRNTAAAQLTTLCKQLEAPASVLTELNDLDEIMYDTVAVGYGPIPVIIPQKVLEEVGNLIVDKAAQTIKDAGVTDVTVNVRDGAPSEIILAAAKEEEADLVVMGSRGLGVFAGMLMGSTSHKVSHLAECTCVTVK